MSDDQSPKRAILVRVGIDSTKQYGHWNAPVDAVSGDYVYVPLLESREQYRARPHLRRGYDEVVPALARLNRQLPAGLASQEMHLDPDFEYLTYGDAATPRGKRIATVRKGDWLVFFSGFQALHCDRPLHYAIFGKFVVAEVVPADRIDSTRAHENAHTRPPRPLPTDRVIRAQPGVSGRLRNCIPIGELRGTPPRYRVRLDILSKWGGLHSKDGYIQRGSPFELPNPARFAAWLGERSLGLIASNW